MRAASTILSLLAAVALAGCDLPSTAGPTAAELALEEDALALGADPVEAAETADAVDDRPGFFATLFQPRETGRTVDAADVDATVASLEANESVDAVVAEDDDVAEPTVGGGFFSALFQPREAEDSEEPATDENPNRAVRAVELPRTRITVAGPPGYCIETDSITSDRTGGFVLLGSCNILTDGETGADVEPAIMTVSIGAPGTGRDLPSSADLATLLDSPMIGGKDLGSFSVAHLRRGGNEILENGDDRHWRAAFSFRGRLIGLALYAPAGSPLVFSEDGADLIAALRNAIVSATSGRPVVSTRNRD